MISNSSIKMVNHILLHIFRDGFFNHKISQILFLTAQSALQTVKNLSAQKKIISQIFASSHFLIASNSSSVKNFATGQVSHSSLT